MSRAETGDRRVMSLLEPTEARLLRSDGLPYYVELLPWYRLDDDKVEKWQHDLADIAASTEAFEVEAGEEDYFGRRHNTLVRHLAGTALRPLHFRLLNRLTSDKAGIKAGLLSIADVGKGYQPHINQKYDRLIELGQTLRIDNLTEIQLVDNGFGQPDVEILAQHHLRRNDSETAA